MPTLIECKDIEKNIELCNELGLDFIEINMNLPQFQIDAVKKNNHLPLGDGKMDLQSKIDIAKANGCTCVIETKTIEG
jgi:sugar phosphate isomerase/epimerase